MTGTNGVSENMRAVVRDKLREIERDHGVRVLFAVESGSRAWGFASPDSDYDVRFVYLHSHDWYLSLIERRDVIEEMIEAQDLDVSGWDLRKALRLLLKSNPPLYEWMVSPILYSAIDGVVPALRKLADEHYSLRATAWHYLRMAERTRNAYFGDRAQVNLKKYFYIIRPVCALTWLRQNDKLPPMNMQQMIDGLDIPAPTRSAIDELRVRKAASSEVGNGAPAPVIDRWLAEMMDAGIDYCQNAPVGDRGIQAVEAYFHEVLSRLAPSV